MVQLSTAASNEFAEGRPFGFADAGRLLRERGRLVRNVALGFIALTVIVLLLWPSSYSTSAVVMLDPRKNNITDRSEVLSELPTDPASVQDQIQILTSRDLAATVIKRLGLDRDPDYNRALAPIPMSWFALGLSPEAQFTTVVDAFLKHLTVEAEGLSTAVTVTFSAGEPDKAARVANAIVGAYIDAQVGQKSEAARRTTQWLSDRIAELGRQDQVAEAEVQAYKAANELNDGGQGTQSLVDQQLGTINTQLVQARADLAEKQATYNHVVELVKSGRAADVSQVVASPLIEQLREQQADAIRSEADLDTRYGPRHPKRIAVESQLRDLDSKVEQEVERIAGSVANDVAVARAQEQSLEASLARARAEANTQNVARVKLKALEAGAASTRAMFESFMSRLREAQDQGAVMIPDARIISHASIPAKPSFPPRLLGIAASIPLGFLLGLLCALIMERAGYEAPRSMGAAPGPRNPRAPVLGVVPDALRPLASDQIVTDPSSPFARALSALALPLSSAFAGGAPRTILISGADPREGRTNVAVGLARALAALGRNVVVVDADFGVSAAAWTMGVDRARPGLLDVLRGSAQLSNALGKDVRSPVLLLRSDAVPCNPGAFWSAPETKALFAHLRQTADFVIIDAPAGDELAATAQIADGALVVGSADRPEPARAMAAALGASAAVETGIVLTR